MGVKQPKPREQSMLGDIDACGECSDLIPKRLELNAGHTPGHAIGWLESKGERALFAGDSMHSAMQVEIHLNRLGELYGAPPACLEEAHALTMMIREAPIATSRATFSLGAHSLYTSS